MTDTIDITHDCKVGGLTADEWALDDIKYEADIRLLYAQLDYATDMLPLIDMSQVDVKSRLAQMQAEEGTPQHDSVDKRVNRKPTARTRTREPRASAKNDA